MNTIEEFMAMMNRGHETSEIATDHEDTAEEEKEHKKHMKEINALLQHVMNKKRQ